MGNLSEQEILNRLERLENKLGLSNISEEEKDLFLEMQTEGIMLDDVIMPLKKKKKFEELINEQKNKERIKKYNLKPINTLLLFGGPGSGKAVTLNTKILTPNGWITMKDIKVGDIVFDGEGKPTTVVGTFPQGKRTIYRIHFDDKTYIDVDEEHLNIFYQTKRLESHRIPNGNGKRIVKWGKDYKILTTLELIDYLKKENSKSKVRPLRVDLPIPKFKKKEIEVDGYILGLLLGDGCITGKNFSFTNLDKDVIESLSKYCKKLGGELVQVFYKDKPKDKQCDYRINCKVLKEKIKKIGLLGKNSYTKFVPKEYLFNDYNTRLSILQGLIDTDGCVCNYKSKKGYNYCTYEYTTVSPQLSEDFSYLARSLGCVVTITTTIGSYKNEKGEKIKCKKVYRHYIRVPQGLKLVKCKRKLEKVKDKQLEEPVRKIVKITKKKEKEEAKCITVSSKAHTYIIDNITPTHNTMVCKALSNELQYHLYTIDISQALGGANPLRQIKAAFNYADEHAPCLLFLDEVDGIVPQRGSKKTSQETAQITNYIMQRLNEMNGNVENDVVLLSASNFLYGIDDAFKNRFSIIINMETPYDKIQVIRDLFKGINKKAGMNAFELVEDAEQSVIDIINQTCASDAKRNISVRQLEFIVKRIIKKEILTSYDEVLRIYLTDILKEMCRMMLWNMTDQIISLDEEKAKKNKEEEKQLEEEGLSYDFEEELLENM